LSAGLCAFVRLSNGASHHRPTGHNEGSKTMRRIESESFDSFIDIDAALDRLGRTVGEGYFFNTDEDAEFLDLSDYEIN
jgi:hypothetical protein